MLKINMQNISLQVDYTEQKLMEGGKATKSKFFVQKHSMEFHTYFLHTNS